LAPNLLLPIAVSSVETLPSQPFLQLSPAPRAVPPSNRWHVVRQTR
jgi:hypothetical protein